MQRLKEYHAKLVLLPRRRNAKRGGAKPHPEEASAEERAKVSQLHGVVLPIKKAAQGPQWGTIPADASKKSAYVVLRNARADARLVGRRIVRQKRIAEKKAAKAAKKE